MKNEKRRKTKQEIIQAAITCINEHGLNNTTIRKIAQVAGVNSAAISYYFGSREELLTKAMEIALDNAFDFGGFQYMENDDYKTILKIILKDWKRGAAAYPGIFHAHFDDIINKRIDNNITLERINDFIDKVYQVITKHGLEETDLNFKKLKLIFGAFISTLIMPAAAYPINDNDEIEVLAEML